MAENTPIRPKNDLTKVSVADGSDLLIIDGTDGVRTISVDDYNEQVSAAAATGGVLKRDTITATKAVQSSVLDAAGLIVIWNTDGNGGGIYRFKLGGTEVDGAEDGKYIRPNDYATAGPHQGTLEKFIG